MTIFSKFSSRPYKKISEYNLLMAYYEKKGSTVKSKGVQHLAFAGDSFTSFFDEPSVHISSIMSSILLQKLTKYLLRIIKPCLDPSGSVLTDNDQLPRPEENVGDSEGIWINGNGRFFISNREIAKGSHGTVVFEGLYEGRRVAVKRVLQEYYVTAEQEIDLLYNSDRNPYIVQLYSVVRDQNFIYLLLELCFCNLAELIQKHSQWTEYTVHSRCNEQKFQFWRKGSPSIMLVNLMR
ncbi:hypothetical protein AMTR_s00001p00256870 [Amborella trichopoda]|uniref:non-specific serine/threonine protein kinase n=1 Tax=Amborella trichopoda TaxID=13333 RepID=W1NKV8_AMBTC|nr:hypothetical protein AMTR_s00001p00256870 [Amborella trichopoda]